MNIEEVRDYCAAKKGFSEGLPFNEEVLVFKVLNKIFLFLRLGSSPLVVSLKMDAELVPQFREKYVEVQPGYHLNKKMWNSVNFETGSINRKELLWMLDHSYEQVVKGMPKKLQQQLNDLP